MNSFLFSAITLCLAAQCALAQYQSTPSYGYQQQQQRKMAPTPQTYVPQQQQQQQYDAGSQYGAMEQSSYGSKTASSNYGEERAPAPAAYAKQQSSGYASQQRSDYGAQQQQSGYGKQAAPKYEEPYHPPMPFAWGYDINDGYGGAQYHKENGDEYGKRTGSYGYTDAYGIYRQVDYVADEHGFRATIKTNEPGTANESPASVDLHAYEPPSNYYAGTQQKEYASASYAAPAKSSYAPAAAAAAATAAAPSYGAPSQRQSYSASASASSRQQQYQPRAPAAAQPAYGPSGSSSSSSSLSKSSGASPYGMPSSQRGYQQQSPYYANEAAAQYLSSVIVPVYQKSAQAVKVAAAPVAAKRVY